MSLRVFNDLEILILKLPPDVTKKNAECNKHPLQKGATNHTETYSKHRTKSFGSRADEHLPVAGGYD